MEARNSDSLNVTSLKVEDNSLSTPFQGLQLGIAGLCLSRFAGLISFLLLFISAGLIFSLPLFDAPGLISSLKLSDGKSG